ncbi:hypothetical protein UFOVP244_180 [uncultured Caudovirales phage]|uniref:Uncharacterized protein n=1 Tax=uncultured Caudovirales phage TaxID=2100421 RepID=A0A6J7WUQ6_9CAUD|nr:hypothetical protein UFOVP244_180 [uncultured Caudovirales phage]
MTVYSKLSILINGIQTNVDFSQADTTLSVRTLRITDGMSSHDINSELLNVLLNGSDASQYHHHDSLYYRKAQVDSIVAAEATIARNAEGALSGRLNTVEGVGAGSIAKALQDAKDFATGAVSDEATIARNAELALSNRLDTVEGVGAGSIQKALQDAKDWTDSSISNLINGAPQALDTLKEIADQLRDDEDAVSALIATVNTNRTDLHNEVVAEQNRALAAEGLISTSVTTERNARIAEDARIEGLVTSQGTSFQGQIAQLGTDLHTEQTTARNAEEALSGRLNTVEGVGVGSIAKALQDAKDFATGAVSDEATIARNAELALSNRLDTVEGVGAGSIAKALQDAKDFTEAAISSLVDGAEGALDTLKEIAEQLRDDEDAVSALIATVNTNRTDLHNEVVAERNRALAAEGDLNTSFGTQVIRLDGRITDLETSLTTLISEQVADARATYVYLNNAAMMGVSSGKAVRVSASDSFDVASNAGASTATGAFGVAAQTTSYGQSTKIQVAGRAQVSSMEMFTPGSRVYLGADGQATMTPPESAGSAVVLLGVACSSNEVILNVQLVSVNAGSSGGGGGGGGGGGSTFSYYFGMQSGENYDVNYTVVNSAPKWVGLQKSPDDGNTWQFVAIVQPTTYNFGSISASLLAGGDLVRLALYEDNLGQMITYPEVASPSWVAIINGVGGGGGGTPSLTNVTYAPGMMSPETAYFSWTASNVPTGKYYYMFAVSQDPTVHAPLYLGGSQDPYGAVNFNLLDPSFTYVVALSEMDWAAEGAILATSDPFQVPQGTAGNGGGGGGGGGGAETLYLQQTAGYFDGSQTANPRYLRGITFMGNGQSLTKLAVRLKYNYGSGTVKFLIRDSFTGTPVSTSNEIDITTLVDSPMTEFTFSSPAVIASGTRYYAEIFVSGGEVGMQWEQGPVGNYGINYYWYDTVSGGSEYQGTWTSALYTSV